MRTIGSWLLPFFLAASILGLFYLYSRGPKYFFGSRSNDTRTDRRWNHSMLDVNRKSIEWPEWTYSYSLQPWNYNPKTKKKKVNRHGQLMKRLPQVIGIGTKKCGTGALQYFLEAHPKVKTTEKESRNEAHFFDSPIYYKGLDYYRSMMSESAIDDVVFEKSPRYFHTARVPSRIQEWNQNVKLVLVVCDPVIRAFSDYTYITTKPRNFCQDAMPNYSDFDEYVDTVIRDLKDVEKDPQETLGYGTYHAFLRNAWNERTFRVTALTNGMYSTHLKDWFTYFSPSQLHIVDGDQLVSNPAPELEKIQKFLDLELLVTEKNIYYDKEKGFYCLKNSPCLPDSKGNTRGGNAKLMSADAMQKLSNFYKPHNEEFFRMTKRRFSWF